MYELIVVGNFCAAHRLQNHPGKCRNIHGHNYRVELKVGYPYNEIGEVGYPVDFSVLKHSLGGALDRWDHCLLLEHDDPLVGEWTQTLHDYTESSGVVIFQHPPTAETMARYLYQDIGDYWLKETGAVHCSVRVWETPVASVMYAGGGGGPS